MPGEATPDTGQERAKGRMAQEVAVGATECGLFLVDEQEVYADDVQHQEDPADDGGVFTQEVLDL